MTLVLILSLLVVFSDADNSTLYRLPKSVYPVSYDVLLLTNGVTRGDFFYKGKVSIGLNVKEETRKIILHAAKLNILKEKTVLKDDEGHDVRIDDQSYDSETQFWTIALSNTLKLGRHSLTLRFDGQVLDELFGFYRSSYKANNQTRWIGVTQFSPTFARRAFPCMDEPGFKATFQLHLGHYYNETVSSNTLTISRNFTSIKNYLITSFAPTPRMSTYLFGWAVHDFEVKTNSSDPRISLWSRLGNLSSSPLIREGPKIYAALESWMSLTNPVSKIEQLAVPDFNFNAMENWGLITYRESNAEAHNPTKTDHRIIVTMSHEYAHTWFGNLVTPEFWNFAWLKEGFATYFSYLMIGTVYPDWRAMDLFTLEVLQESLLSDGVTHTRTMNGNNVGSPKSAKAALDFVTYNKGASVVRMISDIVGEDVFKSALQAYLKERQYEAATPPDLYKQIDAALGASNQSSSLPVSIDKIIETYTDQPNYPLINVSRASSSCLKVSQRPFSLNRTDLENDSFNHSWWVPLKIMTADSAGKEIFEISSTWLSPEEIKIIDIPMTSWYMLNPNQVGYFRVNYDSHNWNALQNLLDSKNFKLLPRVNRASLLDDAFNLARSGLENYKLPLSLTKYLYREEDYEPWISATRAFSLLHKKLRDQSNVRFAFQRYAGSLINPIYIQLNCTENPLDSHIKKMHRNLILSAACSLNLEDCVSRARLIFDNWIDGKIKTVQVNSKSFVYHAGITNGTDDSWEKLWKKFLETKLHSEKELIYDALAHSENPNLINKLINFSVLPESNIAKQYRLPIVKSIIRKSSKNIETVLDYVEQNFRNILKWQGADFLKGIFSTIGEEITSTRQTEMLSLFTKGNITELQMFEGTINEAIKLAASNIEWIGRSANEIHEYLNTK